MDKVKKNVRKEEFLVKLEHVLLRKNEIKKNCQEYSL